MFGEHWESLASDFSAVYVRSNSLNGSALEVVCPAHWCGIDHHIDTCDWEAGVGRWGHEVDAVERIHWNFHNTAPDNHHPGRIDFDSDLATEHYDHSLPRLASAPAPAPEQGRIHCDDWGSHCSVDILCCCIAPGLAHSLLDIALDHFCDRIGMRELDSEAIAAGTGGWPCS